MNFKNTVFAFTLINCVIFNAVLAAPTLKLSVPTKPEWSASVSLATAVNENALEGEVEFDLGNIGFTKPSLAYEPKFEKGILEEQKLTLTAAYGLKSGLGLFFGLKSEAERNEKATNHFLLGLESDLPLSLSFEGQAFVNSSFPGYELSLSREFDLASKISLELGSEVEAFYPSNKARELSYKLAAELTYSMTPNLQAFVEIENELEGGLSEVSALTGLSWSL